jgi:hypothetical protein
VIAICIPAVSDTATHEPSFEAMAGFATSTVPSIAAIATAMPRRLDLKSGFMRPASPPQRRDDDAVRRRTAPP